MRESVKRQVVPPMTTKNLELITCGISARPAKESGLPVRICHVNVGPKGNLRLEVPYRHQIIRKISCSRTTGAQIRETPRAYSQGDVHHIDDLLGEILGLAQSEDAESRPSDYACEIARNLFSEIDLPTLSQFPHPSISLDGDGGILLDWTRGEKRVRLVIRDNADLPSYIYHQSGDVYDAIYDMTSESLKKWLYWLMNE